MTEIKVFFHVLGPSKVSGCAMQSSLVRSVSGGTTTHDLSIIVFYDLETTNFIRSSREVGAEFCGRFFGNQTVPRSKFGIWIPEIVSIGATTYEFFDTSIDFYVEMTPTSQIHPGSSKVSGYTIQSGKLFFTGSGNDKEREVTGAVEMREGLKRFVTFLNSLAEMASQSGDNKEKKKIILV